MGAPMFFASAPPEYPLFFDIRWSVVFVERVRRPQSRSLAVEFVSVVDQHMIVVQVVFFRLRDRAMISMYVGSLKCDCAK